VPPKDLPRRHISERQDVGEIFLVDSELDISVEDRGADLAVVVIGVVAHVEAGLRRQDAAENIGVALHPGASAIFGGVRSASPIAATRAAASARPNPRQSGERASRRMVSPVLSAFGQSVRRTALPWQSAKCLSHAREIHALNNAFYDLERFGLRFVASPRHADVLLVTGPVTKNMREALERTYAATPDPKWVVAVGNCAADGGIFAGSYAVEGGVSRVVPVDLHISGCPPTPEALLKGLLALIESA
jgi:Ni,Fe-hydrogenase III small subunit